MSQATKDCVRIILNKMNYPDMYTYKDFIKNADRYGIVCSDVLSELMNVAFEGSDTELSGWALGKITPFSTTDGQNAIMVMDAVSSSYAENEKAEHLLKIIYSSVFMGVKDASKKEYCWPRGLKTGNCYERAIRLNSEDYFNFGQRAFNRGSDYYYLARILFYEGTLLKNVRCSEYLAYMIHKNLGEISYTDYIPMGDDGWGNPESEAVTRTIKPGSEKSSIEWYYESVKLGSEKSKNALKKLIAEGDFEAIRYENDPLMR